MGIAVLERLTPTERRFLDALEEGPHSKSELHALLDDELAELNGTAVAAHITNLRGKLPKSFIIVSTGCLYCLHRIVRNS